MIYQIFLSDLGVIILVSLYYTYTFLLSVRKLKKFRGPRALPFIGNCYDPETIVLTKFFTRCRKTYGKVFRFFGLSMPFVVICEPEMIRRILTDTKAFPKGDMYSRSFGYIFGLGLVTSDGERHKKDRGAFSKYFVRTNVATLCPMMNQKCLEIFEQRIEKNVTKDRFTSIDIENICAPLALRVFSQFCTGRDLYQHDEKREATICKVVSEGSYMVAACMTLQLPQFPLFPWTRKLDLVRNEIGKDITTLVDSKRLEMSKLDPADTSHDDCITQMIKDNVSERDMFFHFITLMCAGHDTTAFFSSYCLYVLAQYPDVQERLRKEVFRIMGDRREITADDVTLMTYMKCVMQETLRLFAIIPNLSRHCVDEYEFKDFNITIPAGTNVIIPMGIVNRDPEIWPNPQEFNPDRFEGTEMTCAKKGFFPFGYGSRVCIGNSLAQLESSIFIAHLLMLYSFQPDPSYKLKICTGISLTTFEHIMIQAKKL